MIAGSPLPCAKKHLDLDRRGENLKFLDLLTKRELVLTLHIG